MYVFTIHSMQQLCITTGWRTPVGCLILAGHFPQKSLIISGSFAENDLQLKASYGSSPPCITPTGTIGQECAHSPFSTPKPTGVVVHDRLYCFWRYSVLGN